VSLTPTTPRSRPLGAQLSGSPPHRSQIDSSGWLRGDRLVLGAFAACALLLGYQLAVTLLQPPWIEVATDWLHAVVAWLALLVVGYVAWWSGRAHRPDARVWWLYTAAVLSYAIARSLWIVEDRVIFHDGVPIPTLSDLFFALQYPFFFLGTILILRRQYSLSRVILSLDFLLWMGAAVTLSWFFMLAPIVARSDLPPLGKQVALSYPVGDLFLLLGLTVILLRPPDSRAHAPVVSLLIVTFACLIVGDTWATWILLQPAHVYVTGAVPDLFWLTCYLLLPLAALVQLRITRRELAVNGGRVGDEARRETGGEHILWQDIRASLPQFFPIVAALLASAVLMIGVIVQVARAGWRGDVWPIIMIFGLLLLVIMRQALICLDHARFRREMAVERAHAQALVELNRRKDEFLGVVSHEIRTPLASVAGYIQLLIRRLDAWQPPADGAAVPASMVVRAVARTRAVLTSCEQSLQRLTGLTDDLVDDTRIRDGQLALRRAPCDLRALVRSAVEAQHTLEPDRLILLHPSCLSYPHCAPCADTDAPLLVEADSDRVAQVIANYLSNALKYSKAEHPVEVEVGVLGQPPEERAGERAGEVQGKGVLGQAHMVGVAWRARVVVWSAPHHRTTVKGNSSIG